MAQQKVSEIYVDLVARTAQFKAALNEATSETKRFTAQTREEMNKSRESVKLLSEELGLGIPRGLQGIISKLPGVTTAMNLAFDSVIVFALIDTVVKAGEKIEEFIKKNEEAAKKNAEAWRSLSEPLDSANDKMQVTNDKLEEEIAKLEHKPTNALKTALDEAVDSANTLYTKLLQDNKAAADLIEKNQVGWGSQAIGQMSTDEIAGHVTDQQSKTQALSEARATHARGYRDQLDALGAPTEANKAQRAAIAAEATKQWKADTEELVKGLDTATKLMQSYYNGAAALQKQYAGKGLGSYDYSNVMSVAGGMAHNFQSQSDAEREGSQNLADTTRLSGDKDNKTTADAAAKKRGEMVETLVKQNQARIKEQKRAEDEVAAYGAQLLAQSLDAHIAANRTEEASDKHTADAYIANVRSQIQVQRDLIATAEQKYRSLERSSSERVRFGVETPGQRTTELTQATQQEEDTKAAAYKAIADLFFSIGQGNSPEGIKAKSDYFNTGIEGQDRIADLNQSSDGMIASLNRLTNSFTDTSAIISNTFIQSLHGFNDAVTKILTTPGYQHRNAFGELGKSVFSSVSKSGLEGAEGQVMKMIGFGSHKKADGYHMWMDNLPGGSTSGTTSGIGSGLLGKLNDSNWASSLFGGMLFGSGSLFGGGHALGGDVMGGVPIDVGELGPERFVPYTSGTIMPNNQINKGSPQIHIDARGSNDPAATEATVHRAMAGYLPHIQQLAIASTQDNARRSPGSRR